MAAPALNKPFVQDINKPVRVQNCGDLLFTGDALADTIKVSLYDGTEPLSFTGTVTCNVIRADGSTIPVQGSWSGNTAQATLTAVCFAVPGPLAAIMKISAGGVTTTVLKAVYTVDVGETGTTVDPGTVISNVTALIQAIENAEATIPSDLTNLMAAIAPTFSSGDYVKGQYVWYDGKLYKFSADHSGSWTGTDVSRVPVGNDLARTIKRYLALDHDDTTVIPGQSDLDTYTTPGNYRVSSNPSSNPDASTYIANMPYNRSGRLIVLETSLTNRVAQIYIANDSSGASRARVYFRAKYGSSDPWCAWYYLNPEYDNAPTEDSANLLTSGVVYAALGATSADVIAKCLALSAGYATAIGTGTDFNDYKTPGNYKVSSHPATGAIGHMPIERSGRLTVMTTSISTCVVQFYIANITSQDGGSRFKFYIRSFYNDIWSEWYYLNPAYDDVPTQNSENIVKSGAVYNAAANAVGMILRGAPLDPDSGDVGRQAIDNSGNWYEPANQNASSSVVRVPIGTTRITVTTNANYGTYVAFLKSANTRETLGAADFATGYTSRIKINDPSTVATFGIGSDCKYMWVMLSPNDGSDVKPASIVCESDDAITSIMPTLYEGWFNWWQGKSITSAGEEADASGYASSDPVDVVPGNKLINVSSTSDGSNHNTELYIAEYNGSAFVRRVIVTVGSTYIVPSGVNAIRLVFGFASGVTVTKPVISEYFAVKFLTEAKHNDLETPVYVAYGASTTEGAVHQPSNFHYSPYSFPDYIGRALNMQTYNHSHGSTGFIARASTGNVNNFMDQISADDTLLKTASLITIIFGYGNDKSALLPVGLYNDYYPYDQEGYHPSGSAGITAMLGMGATLFGCLNWCIKWLSEHYPKATLVVMCCSPGANSDREVTLVTNDERPIAVSQGATAYKLNIKEPYDDDPGTTRQHYLPVGDWSDHPNDYISGTMADAQIKTELAKLKKALNMALLNLTFEDGIAINYYNTRSRRVVDPNDPDAPVEYAATAPAGKTLAEYAIFSYTTTSGADPYKWNSHPNDAGYKKYAQYIAGKVISVYKH